MIEAVLEIEEKEWKESMTVRIFVDGKNIMYDINEIVELNEYLFI